LCSFGDGIEGWGRLVSVSRQRLLAIPNRLGAIHDAEVAGAADVLVIEALNALADEANA
jgi:hypothetical protein